MSSTSMGELPVPHPYLVASTLVACTSDFSPTCPSRSWKLPPYIGPISKDGFQAFPRPAIAFATVVTTSSRLSAERQVSTSVAFVASLISPLMKNGRTSTRPGAAQT